MTLDDEKQRQLLLQLISVSTVPGHAVEMVVMLKMAIKNAGIQTKKDSPEQTPEPKLE